MAATCSSITGHRSSPAAQTSRRRPGRGLRARGKAGDNESRWNTRERDITSKGMTMTQDAPSRRQFLHRAGGLAASAVLAGTSSRAAGRGIAHRHDSPGGPSFSTAADPDELAQAHRRLGYRAAYCPAVDLKDEPRIRDIEAPFARHDVVISEVGRWVNLLDADPARRAANHRTVTDGLALAEAIGAAVLRRHRRLVPSHHLVRTGPEEPGAGVLRRRRGERARSSTPCTRGGPKFCYEMVGWSCPTAPIRA